MEISFSGRGSNTGVAAIKIALGTIDYKLQTIWIRTQNLWKYYKNILPLIPHIINDFTG